MGFGVAFALTLLDGQGARLEAQAAASVLRDDLGDAAATPATAGVARQEDWPMSRIPAYQQHHRRERVGRRGDADADLAEDVQRQRRGIRAR